VHISGVRSASRRQAGPDGDAVRSLVIRVQDSEGEALPGCCRVEAAALRGGPRTSPVVQTAPCDSPRARFRRRERPEACSMRRLSLRMTVYR